MKAVIRYRGVIAKAAAISWSIDSWSIDRLEAAVRWITVGKTPRRDLHDVGVDVAGCGLTGRSCRPRQPRFAVLRTRPCVLENKPDFSDDQNPNRHKLRFWQVF